MIRVNKTNQHNGSVILAVLGMATLSSIALLTMMFSIKSLSRTLTLESVQNTAQQLLLMENSKTISSYLENPVVTDVSSSSQIMADGIEYTYNQHLSAAQALNSPMPGFSINSNFGTRLVNFESRVTRENIQSPALFTGIACVDVVHEELNSDVIDRYEMGFSIPLFNSSSYKFNPITGEIWRNSLTESKLIIDLDFESHQRFSRADFAMLNVGNKTRFALIFAVTGSQKPGNNKTNSLYILFDPIDIDQTNSSPSLKERFITLTRDYSPSTDEDGFIVPLGSDQIQLSAITTIDNTIIFIKQSDQTNSLTGLTTRQNTLYQINLSPDPNQASSSMIDTRVLPATNEDVKLMTTMINQTEIIVSTQAQPFLARFPIHCQQVFQYEE